MTSTSNPFGEIESGPIIVTPSNEYPEPGQASVQITFNDGAVLTAAYWRLIKNGTAILSSFDHNQQYGLPAPINAIEELQNELSGSILNETRLDAETGDVLLQLSENRRLEVFNFTGYEIWTLQFPNGATEYSNRVLE